MTTGKSAGSAAAIVLRNPKSSKADRKAAASDLAQRPRRASKSKGK